jgi:hypothetical protein
VGCFAEAASHPVGAPVVAALLAGSPLTDLLTPARIEPRFDLARHARLLARPELARLVAWAWLDEGLDHVGGPVATAALAALDTPAARLICAFLAHLHLCTLLTPSEPREPTRAPARPARLSVGADLPLRDFYGLFAALAKAAPDLAAPPDVHRDPRLAHKLAEHAQACAVACGPPRVAELEALVTRAFSPAAVVSEQT